MTRIAFVVWNGTLGGAETLSLELARRLRETGHDGSLVFVGHPEPLAARANEQGVRHVELGHRRGAQVVLQPRRYAQLVRSLKADLVVIMSGGYLSSALRLGGYRGRVVAVEHGTLVRQEASQLPTRMLRRLDRALAARALDAQVAVSEFMLEQVRRVPHARRLVTIHNGVDVQRFRPPEADHDGPVTFGFGARLVEGKGLDVLIRAFDSLAGADWRLRIAGDGPLRDQLERQAAASRVPARIDFLGRVHDMPTFWRSVDVAVAPSEIVESFGLAPLEAMACGRPAVVTRNGGLVELVVDGVTGAIVPAGDSRALADALRRYLDRDRARRHGRAARARAVERFSLDVCVARYLELAEERLADP